MIINPKLNRYRNAEYLQFMRYILQIMEESGLDSMEAEVSELQVVIDQIDESFQRSAKKPLTQEILVLDIRRDHAINGIKQVLEGYKHHYSEAIQQASFQLLDNIAQHGNDIARLNYQEEISVLNSVTNDWETQENLVSAVNLLNLGEWLIELKDSNKEFEMVYFERVEIVASKDKLKIFNLRKSASKHFYVIIKLIEAHLTLNTAIVFTEIEKKMVVLTNEYNQLIENRSS